jgi:ABC-type branched-subunit amino acid transport system substrate-binding protein
LRKLGINIDLKIFDTEKYKGRINQILHSEGFKNVDLVLGPVSGESCVEVARFCNENKIVNFNFSREDQSFALTNYTFSLRNSFSNTGKQLAKSAKENFDSTKNVKIFYYRSADKTDSLLAYSYKQELEKLKIKVALLKGVDKDMKTFKTWLSGVKDEETSHVMIFGENSLMASNAISVWEAENKKAILVAPKEWLDIQLITYEQYFRKNIHFVYNDYISADYQILKATNAKYISNYGVKPMTYSYLAMGYDVMFFCGKLMGKNGNQFQSQFEEIGYTELPFTFGADLSKTKTNAIIPIVKFDANYNFVWVNQPK